jgi:hypothetical protein
VATRDGSSPSDRAAAWSVNKIEAIDPVSDFWWLDEDASEQDRQWLRAHHRQDRLIVVSADRDPDALSDSTMILIDRRYVLAALATRRSRA